MWRHLDYDGVKAETETTIGQLQSTVFEAVSCRFHPSVCVCVSAFHPHPPTPLSYTQNRVIKAVSYISHYSFCSYTTYFIIITVCTLIYSVFLCDSMYIILFIHKPVWRPAAVSRGTLCCSFLPFFFLYTHTRSQTNTTCQSEVFLHVQVCTGM